MLKLKEWRRAEADASLALLHDPRHVKSLQRRAAARSSMGLHRAALADLAAAAEGDELSSSNNTSSTSSSSSAKSIQAETRKVKELLRATMRHAPKVQVRVNLALSAPMPQPTPPPPPPPPSSPAPQAGAPAPEPAPKPVAATKPKPSTSATLDQRGSNPAKLPSVEAAAASDRASNLLESTDDVTAKEKHNNTDNASAHGSSGVSGLPTLDAASSAANDSGAADSGAADSATKSECRVIVSPISAMEESQKKTTAGLGAAAAAASPSSGVAKAKAIKVVDPKGPFELERMWRLCATKPGSGSSPDVEKRRLAQSLLRPDGKVARVLFGPKALTTMDADLLCDLLLRRLDVMPTAAPGVKGSKNKGTEDPSTFRASFAALAGAPRLARSAAFLSANQRKRLAAALDARADVLGDVATSLRAQLMG